MALHLCPACARHVRETETRCPFCDASVSFTPAARVNTGRLSRAAQMAFVAAIAIGCEETKPPNDPTTANTDASPPPMATIEPPPAATTATSDAGPMNPPPPPDIAKPYGAPPADGLLT